MGPLAADPERGAGDDAGQGHRHLRGCEVDPDLPRRGAGSRGGHGAGRRVRVRAVQRRRRGACHRCGDRRQPDRDRGAVDGIDAIVRHLVPPLRAQDPGQPGRRGQGRRPEWQRADHRLRPLRSGHEPVAAGARRRRDHHRQRHRDDPQRRGIRLQDLLRRRHPAGCAACLRSGQRARHRGLHRQARVGEPDRRTGPAGISAGQVAGALVRSRAFAGAGRRRRRLPDPRDLRVGGELRRSGPDPVGRAGGRSRRDRRGGASAGRRAVRAGNRRGRCARGYPADARQPAVQADAHAVHAAPARGQGAQRRGRAVIGEEEEE